MTVDVGNRELPLKRPSSGVSTSASQGGVGRSTAKDGESITVSMEAEPSPDDLRKWTAIQIPYENLAGTDGELDQKATGFVNDLFHRFQEENYETFAKWALIRRLLDGMRGRRGEGEVAEIYKALERMIPRIEEQVLNYERWFSVHGREDQDRKQTDKIQAFLSWQLEQDRFRHSVQPTIRTMLAYGFAATKTWWETRVERRIKRKHKVKKVEGVDRQTTTLDETKQVVFNGPRCRLVDPFDFIIDVDAIDVRDANYVGDLCEMTYDEIAELGRAGVYQNWEQLADQEPLTRSDFNQWYKEARDSGRSELQHQRRHIEGAPRLFYVAEVWGLFDLYGTGETRECVITLANFQVPIRIQENPYDDKHRPYAVCRANRDAFDFFSVGPLDNAVRPQLEMNEHRWLALRSHKNSLAPVIVTDDLGDLPDTLWEAEPGAILQGAAGNMQEFKMSSTIGEMRYSDSILQRDIEEITGSTRMLGGTENSDTATESVQKLSESSRRLRAYIQSYTMGLNDMLRQWHSLNGQYVTAPMKFRVLGKKAKGLSAYETMDAEVLQTEVDFTFTALGSLHSGELRATQLMQWLNLATPIIAQYPGQVDQLRILQLLMRDMVGSVDETEIINIPTRPEELMMQDEENILLAQGQEVEIDPQDDDDEHLNLMEERWGQDMEGAIGEYSDDPDRLGKILTHWQSHVSAAKAKALARRNQEEGTPPAFSPPQQAFDTNRGTTGNQQMPGDENPLQNKQGSIFNQTGQGGQRGETSGPPMVDTMGAPDRQTGMNQPQNMM